MAGARHEWPGEVAIAGDKLTGLVRQIVEAVQPEKIILFGSAARGSAGPGSDLDLLVIKSGDYHHISMAQRIYAALGPREFAKVIYDARGA